MGAIKLVLANRDYGPAGDGWGAHMSDEGLQLQNGLEAAGWTLVGAGYGDGCRNVPELLHRYAPHMVFVSDKRDFSADSPGCFRRDIEFTGLEILRAADVFKTCVVKDAGTVSEYHRAFCEEIGADAVVIYYWPTAVLALNHWIAAYPLVRTYHSVNADLCARIPMDRLRAPAVVSGALSPVYPIRRRVIAAAADLGISVISHPGYSNRGTHTPTYLWELARFKTHIATASRYGFALRKIIESVAVGCTPITDLPAEDVLPEIDGALVRIPPNCSVGEVYAAVHSATVSWNFDERMAWAERARRWYDWHAVGARLDDALRREQELMRHAG